MIGVVTGDCLDALAAVHDGTVDAIVTDPPYDLTTGKRGGSGAASINLDLPYGRARIGTGNGAGGFMGKAWDGTGVAFDPATWREALRVLKPGGHLLAFGGTRTYHRLTCAVEDAGFEVRDCLAWLYGSGFPKSLDASKAIDKAAGAEREIVGYRRPEGSDVAGEAERDSTGSHIWTGELRSDEPATPDAERWRGWGTALKPAHEPIVLARKPLAGTVAATVLAHGTGALNVDGCRIAGVKPHREVVKQQVNAWEGDGPWKSSGVGSGDSDAGRWPANVILDPEAAALLDEQTGESMSRVGQPRSAAAGDGWGMTATGAEYADSGGASRFFYVAKASAAERNAGLDGFPEKVTRDTYGDGLQGPRPHTADDYEWQRKGARNVHPTVKPIDLMRWLVRLVTPPGGLVIDPFAGSGTTGIACVLEGLNFIGIEREPEYADIARARIEWWSRRSAGDTDAVLASLRADDARAGQLELIP
jgi:site-specific DNA-methyltransferase (adenine-specific)